MGADGFAGDEAERHVDPVRRFVRTADQLQQPLGGLGADPVGEKFEPGRFRVERVVDAVVERNHTDVGGAGEAVFMKHQLQRKHRLGVRQDQGFGEIPLRHPFAEGRCERSGSGGARNTALEMFRAAAFSGFRQCAELAQPPLFAVGEIHETDPGKAVVQQVTSRRSSGGDVVGPDHVQRELLAAAGDQYATDMMVGQIAQQVAVRSADHQRAVGGGEAGPGPFGTGFIPGAEVEVHIVGAPEIVPGAVEHRAEVGERKHVLLFRARTQQEFDVQRRLAVAGRLLALDRGGVVPQLRNGVQHPLAGVAVHARVSAQHP